MVELCLLAIGICLVIYSLMGLKKENNNFNSVLNMEVNNFKEEDSQIATIRVEIAESILDLQKEIQELRKRIEEISENEEDNIDAKDDIQDKINYEENNRDVDELLDYNDSKVYEEKVILDHVSNHDKINYKRKHIQTLVKEKLKEGKSIEDISTELGIGRGEILLIQDLKLG